MPTTIEPPAKETRQSREAEHKAGLKEMETMFNNSLAGQEAASAETEKAEPVKQEEPVKQADPKKPEPTKGDKQEKPKAEAVKEENKPEAAKEEAKPKKKSAADAVLDDEPVQDPMEDEVEKIVSDPNPNWEKARETMRKQSQELKELRTKVETAPKEATNAITQELEKIRSEFKTTKEQNDKLRDTIRQLDVRFDPDVIEKQESRNKHVNKIVDRIKEVGGDVDSFLAAMEMPVNKRDRMLDKFRESIESEGARAAINERIAKIEVMDEEISEITTDYDKSFEKLRQQREVQAQQTQAERQAVIEATFKTIREQLPKMSRFMRPAPVDAEGAQEFNEQLSKDLDTATKFLSPQTREDAAIWAFKVARYDSLEKIAVERIKAKDAQISELEQQVAKYEGADPGHRGGAKPKALADHERPMVDIFREALGESNARF